MTDPTLLSDSALAAAIDEQRDWGRHYWEKRQTSRGSTKYADVLRNYYEAADYAGALIAEQTRRREQAETETRRAA